MCGRNTVFRLYSFRIKIKKRFITIISLLIDRLALDIFYIEFFFLTVIQRSICAFVSIVHCILCTFIQYKYRTTSVAKFRTISMSIVSNCLECIYISRPCCDCRLNNTNGDFYVQRLIDIVPIKYTTRPIYYVCSVWFLEIHWA